MTRDERPAIVGVLLAGGAARRMGGGDKALALLDGRPLLAHAIDRLSPQVDTMILSANGDPSRFAAFGLPVVADTIPSAGPLAGLHSAMLWAQANRSQAACIVSVPTDTPFFPPDLVSRLMAAAGTSGIAIARCGGRDHRVFGLFPVACADALKRFLRSAASPKVGDWLSDMGYGIADFAIPEDGVDPFFNVNTPEDLQRAETIHATTLGLRPARN